MPPAREPPLSAPLLLYVEDEVLIQAMVVEALEEAGFAAITATNSSDALKALKTRSEIRGLITDISLNSKLDGWEVARLARERSHDLPVIYVSGTHSHDWGSKGVPNSLMISKPFAPAQIVVAISTLMDSVIPA